MCITKSSLQPADLHAQRFAVLKNVLRVLVYRDTYIVQGEHVNLSFSAILISDAFRKFKSTILPNFNTSQCIQG